MSLESPQEPQPDDLPEDQRTGDEPDPSGKAPQPGAPSKMHAAIERSGPRMSSC
jgi:hypothetical protein